MKNVLFFSLLLAVLLLFPGHYPGWFDAGEFSSAAWTLGVSHAPGHAPYVMVANLFTTLPFGPVAFRTSLLSVASAVVMAVALVDILKRLGCPTYLTLAAPLLTLLHPSIALQITRTEVYALQGALSLVLVGLMLRYLLAPDARLLFVLSWLVGVLTVLQPLLTLLFLPAFIIPFLFSRSKEHPGLGLVALFALLGTATSLFLPLRAQANPAVNWDNSSSLSGFIQLITAKDFHIFFHAPVSAKGVKAIFSGDLFTLFPVPVLLLAGYAIVHIFVTGREFVATFFGSAFSFSLLPWLAKDFYLQNPDSHAYVMLPISLGILLALYGATLASQFLFLKLKRERWAPALPVFCMVIGVAYFILIGGLAALSAHASKDADILSRHLDDAPVKGGMLVASDHWLFPINYRQYVEGRRPDVVVVSPRLSRAAWYRDQILSRHDDLKGRIVWEEQSLKSDRKFAGFLLTNGTEAPSSRKTFLSLCRTLSKSDPFEIRRSICSQVVLTSAYQIATDQSGVFQAIELLEDLVDVPRSKVSCYPLKPIVLPIPLVPDNSFLPDSRTPITALGKLYLGCQKVDQARGLLESHELDENGRRILAVLLRRDT